MGVYGQVAIPMGGMMSTLTGESFQRSEEEVSSVALEMCAVRIRQHCRVRPLGVVKDGRVQVLCQKTGGLCVLDITGAIEHARAPCLIVCVVPERFRSLVCGRVCSASVQSCLMQSGA